MAKKFYITTAIDYTNGPPHIGHAYEKVLADAMARFVRLTGREVYFLTGLDQHGQKVQQTAEKAGVSPEDYVKKISASFPALWDRLDVRRDGWVETTDPRHKRIVQNMLQQLYDAGQIYKKMTSGWYSVRQEQFLSDKDREPDGSWGPQWGQVEEREEENYYFRLSDHAAWLKEFLAAHPDFVFPANRLTQLINSAAESGGTDLCISRPKTRLRWGIELPFDSDYVTFVWFDALTNYISFAGFRDPDKGASGLPAFEDLWPCDCHVIGKDILIPAHGIYWPIMLHACGVTDADMPKILVHGFWNLEGRKYSKSESVEAKPLRVLADYGPNAIADAIGADGLRYFLLAEMATGQDADLSEERILLRYNKDLADILGNLLNRTLNMARKYLPAGLAASDSDGELHQGLRAAVAALPGNAVEAMKTWQIHKVLADCIDTARLANEFIDKTAPFKLAKDPANAAAVAAIMRHVVETLAHLSVLISPAMPSTAKRIQTQLGWAPPDRFTLSDLKWGLLPDGHLPGEPQPLFPKVLPPEEVKK
ncbi:MAG TPA: methionine--tRNA ligase [Verrucomicrobiales bacterium]|nr:methionine--tRNA ligase [Verrucomicrobiales bacterium]